MHTAPTRPEAGSDAGAVPNARFAYEYVTLWRVEFGNAAGQVPVRVRGEAVGPDLRLTVAYFDGRPPETHLLLGGASGARAAMLPAAFAPAED